MKNMDKIQKVLVKQKQKTVKVDKTDYEVEIRMSEKRSCLTCELNCVCFAYISIEKVLSECEFINKEEDVADYPEEVISSEEGILGALANACTNYIETGR